MAMPEMATIYDEIDSLIVSPSADLDAIERTLTDGYAHALAIEADQWRIEKRIGELAEALHRGDTSPTTKELAELARRRDDNTTRLATLRDALAGLRRHAERVRADL
jgi:uncharacterized membrane protein YccC